MQDYKIDLEDFKTKAGSVPCEKLCEIIVSHRYLGIMKDEALICMIELARRRLLGEEFEFENYITELHNKLPKFKIDMTTILKAPFPMIPGFKL